MKQIGLSDNAYTLLYYAFDFLPARQVWVVPVANYICFRIILTIGFLVFSLAVLYVVSRRIGLLTLQRKLADAIRSGSISAEDIIPKVRHEPPPTTAPPVYDEL